MSGIIYHIFCIIIGKAYVGQTWNSLKKRKKAHLSPKSECVKIRNAIQKYGKNSFVFSVLTKDLIDQKAMDDAESYWINYFDCIENGYNLRYGGGSHGLMSFETKKKMSVAKKGIPRGPMSAETKARISETRKRVGAGIGNKYALGLRHAPETKSRIGESLKGNKNASRIVPIEERRKRGKGPFVDQNGVRYETQIEAAAILSITQSNVSAVLRGAMKSTKGYIFRYIEVPDVD